MSDIQWSDVRELNERLKLLLIEQEELRQKLMKVTDEVRVLRLSLRLSKSRVKVALLRRGVKQ